MIITISNFHFTVKTSSRDDAVAAAYSSRTVSLSYDCCQIRHTAASYTNKWHVRNDSTCTDANVRTYVIMKPLCVFASYPDGLEDAICPMDRSPVFSLNRHRSIYIERHVRFLRPDIFVPDFSGRAFSSQNHNTFLSSLSPTPPLRPGENKTRVSNILCHGRGNILIGNSLTS